VADAAKHPIKRADVTIDPAKDQDDLITGGIEICERITHRRGCSCIGGEIGASLSAWIAPDLVHVTGGIAKREVLDAGAR